jgi:UDP-N-acetylmuramoyl-tripeptide--D-alanyl-D-alanine ligase
LACLATAWRSRLDLQVAAVTGTNGKTTTKDLLAAMLRAAGPTLATAGNFNNHLGLPLTLLGLSSAHAFAVVEVGASAVGDIAKMAPWAFPHTGIITNASEAHLAEFHSLEDIIQGKGELLDALPVDGCAVLNADSPGFDAWKKRARCRVLSFGLEKADHVWRWLPPDVDTGPRIELDGQTWPVPLPGEHNGANLCAALLAARSFGLSDEVIREGLSGFAGSAHRGVLLEIGGRLILDDCYNANPVSMIAAGRTLGRLPGSGRTVAILGAMAELGPDSALIHEQTGRELAAGPVDLLILVGKNARPLGEGFDAGGGVSHYGDDLKEAARLAALHTRAGDRLLIKGSRSAAMEEILPLLTEAFRNN